MGIRQIGATLFSDRGQHACRRIEVAVNYFDLTLRIV